MALSNMTRNLKIAELMLLGLPLLCRADVIWGGEDNPNPGICCQISTTAPVAVYFFTWKTGNFTAATVQVSGRAGQGLFDAALYSNGGRVIGEMTGESFNIPGEEIQDLGTYSAGIQPSWITITASPSVMLSAETSYWIVLTAANPDTNVTLYGGTIASVFQYGAWFSNFDWRAKFPNYAIEAN